MSLTTLILFIACTNIPFHSTINKIEALINHEAKVAIVEKTETLESKVEYKEIQLSINYANKESMNLNLNSIASISSLLLYQEEFRKVKEGKINTTISSNDSNFNIEYALEDLQLVNESIRVYNTFLYGIANINKDSLEYFYYKEAQSINDTSINLLYNTLSKQDRELGAIVQYSLKEYKFKVEDDYRYLHLSVAIEYSKQKHMIDLFIDPDSLEIIAYDL